MSDRVQESVSVFMDGEADELSVRRLLMQEDADLVRTSWSRFHRQRRVLQGADLRFEQLDVSLSVMSAIAAEPAYGATEKSRRIWLKPVAGLAVAASVAAVVVVTAPGWRQAGSAVSPVVVVATPATSSNENTANSQDTSNASTQLTASTIQLPDSVYLANGEAMPVAPVLNFPQRFSGGIPASLQTGDAVQPAAEQSFMYSMPSSFTPSARNPDIRLHSRLNPGSYQPVLYKPVSRAAYGAELDLPAAK